MCTHTNEIVHILVYGIVGGFSGEHQNQPRLKYGERFLHHHGHGKEKGGSKMVVLFEGGAPYGGRDCGGIMVLTVFMMPSHSQRIR